MSFIWSHCSRLFGTEQRPLKKKKKSGKKAYLQSSKGFQGKHNSALIRENTWQQAIMQMDKQFLNQGKKVSQSTQEHSVYVFLLSGRQSEQCHFDLDKKKKKNPKQNAFSGPVMWIKTAAKNITSSTVSEPLCVLTNHIRPHHLPEFGRNILSLQQPG